jgi:uridine kinase
MDIRDMVKLIYQSEFAGGHLIKNEDDSLRRLKDEIEQVKKSGHLAPDNAALFENISSGLCRLNLRGLFETGISIETVNRFFVNTANSVSGSLSRFEEKLNILRQCCEDRELPFAVEELDMFLSEYRKSGYPAVGHSEEYRREYSPSYRIVKAEYCKFFSAFSSIDSLMRTCGSVNVAIDGCSGSGKSMFASLLAGVYDCNVFHTDHFFLTPAMRTAERLSETGGNFDYERFKEEIINGIISGSKFSYRVYNCSKMIFDSVIDVTPKKLNIIEGCYSMHPTLIENYDLKIFLHTSSMEQSRRIFERSGKDLYERFVSEWIPMENRYFKEMKIREKSDLVFET